MRAGSWLALAALAAGIRAAPAEPVYVIDQLVVSVASTPDGGGERVATVRSGDRLELLERQQGEARVRLASGAQGWIKTSYLSAEPPAARRLSEQSAELDKLRQQVAGLQSELAAVRATGRARAESAAPAAAGTVPPTARETAPLIGNVDRSVGLPWVWIVASCVGTLLVGFVLGWRILDRRIRRKYGGLRIY